VAVVVELIVLVVVAVTVVLAETCVECVITVEIVADLVVLGTEADVAVDTVDDVVVDDDDDDAAAVVVVVAAADGDALFLGKCTSRYSASPVDLVQNYQHLRLP
jgi:hypothetical protein